MASARIHLGILDAVPPEFYPPGEKADSAKFVDLFERIDAPMRFTAYEATQGDFPDALDDCDAYLITGSPCSVYDTYPWIKDFENFIHHAFSAAKPLVGICFGHQLIAQTLGGKVQLAEQGWTLGLYDIEIASERDWMTGGASTHPLYFINQDQVVRLPPDAELLASSATCPNAMYVIGDRLFSLQAHPEQPLESMHTFTQLLVDKYHVDDDTARHARETMAQGEPEANRIAAWIDEFLRAAL